MVSQGSSRAATRTGWTPLAVPGTGNQSSSSSAALLMGARIPAGETSEQNIPALPLDLDSAFYACQGGGQALRSQKKLRKVDYRIDADLYKKLL